MTPMFREMRRHKQQLTTEQCELVLTHEKRGVLAVLGDGGYPYALPLNYVYGDGRLYFHSAREGHKLDAIAKEPKASFCVMHEVEQEPGSWWYHMHSVIAFGTMSIVEDEAERHDALTAIGRKYFPPEDDVEHEVAKSGPRAHILRLDIEHLSGKHVREK